MTMNLREWDRLEQSVAYNEAALRQIDRLVAAVSSVQVEEAGGARDVAEDTLRALAEKREELADDLAECQRRLGASVLMHAPGALDRKDDGS